MKDYPSNYNFLNDFNSYTAKVIAQTAANPSAIGAENITPSIPKKIGKTIIKGSKKITCLVKERKIPRFAFPIAVKKFAVIGCSPLIKVQNKKIRKNFSAKRK